VTVPTATGNVEPTGKAARIALLRGAGIQIEPHSWIYGDRLTVGPRTFIGYGCHIENREHVRIGAGCAIANQVTIVSSTHQFGPPSARAGEYRGAPVTIEDEAGSVPAWSSCRG
jgi:acetyltransferase-like isoleucine patch superfamily enzyme